MFYESALNNFRNFFFRAHFHDTVKQTIKIYWKIFQFTNYNLQFTFKKKKTNKKRSYALLLKSSVKYSKNFWRISSKGHLLSVFQTVHMIKLKECVKLVLKSCNLEIKKKMKNSSFNEKFPLFIQYSLVHFKIYFL